MKEGRNMRLYFESPAGRRIAIDTDKKEYCSGNDIEGAHRFIWLDSETDLEIMEKELDFCGWAYGTKWTSDSPAGAGIPDRLQRPRRV